MAEFTAADREGIENAFDEIELWLGTAPHGYEYIHEDGRVSSPSDAWSALSSLRVLLLGRAG